MKKNIGLIGAGYWGKNLARNFFDLGSLHTICDTNSTLLQTYQEKYPGVRLSTSLQELLANPEIPRIAIAAPAMKHYEIAKQCLLAGKDVYVEKPLCLDSREGEELIRIAESKGLILMVGHLLHYHPCVLKLQEIVAQGGIGKLQYVVSNRLNHGSYRTEENALWNFAPHDVSVILSLCGFQLPEKVRCVGADYLSHGVADTTLTTLLFNGGVRAHIYVSWLNPFKEQKLTVIGSHGMAVFDDTSPWGKKLLLYPNHVVWTHGRTPIANKVEPIAIDPEQKEPLKEECLHFIHCCDTRTIPRTDGVEGLRVLQVLQAAQESLNDDGEAHNPLERHIKSLEGKERKIHPTAVIDEGAEIGSDTHIWHFSHIMSGAKIGPACRIGQNVLVASGVTLGRNVKVQNNVSIYSGVVCEDDVFLGPSMVFTNILNPRSEFVRRDQYLKTLVKKGTSIGANATILCGITLGEYSFIGAGAVVTKDVNPYALVLGNPAKQVGWMSRFGAKLDLPVTADSGKPLTAVCPGTGEKYRLEGDRLMTSQEQLTSRH